MDDDVGPRDSAPVSAPANPSPESGPVVPEIAVTPKPAKGYHAAKFEVAKAWLNRAAESKVAKAPEENHAAEPVAKAPENHAAKPVAKTPENHAAHEIAKAPENPRPKCEVAKAGENHAAKPEVAKAPENHHEVAKAPENPRPKCEVKAPEVVGACTMPPTAAPCLKLPCLLALKTLRPRS